MRMLRATLLLLTGFLALAQSLDCVGADSNGIVLRACNYDGTPSAFLDGTYECRPISTLAIENTTTVDRCYNPQTILVKTGYRCQKWQLVSWTERFMFSANQFGQMTERLLVSRTECSEASVKEAIEPGDYPNYEWSSGFGRTFARKPLILKQEVKIFMNGICSFTSLETDQSELSPGSFYIDFLYDFDATCVQDYSTHDLAVTTTGSLIDTTDTRIDKFLNETLPNGLTKYRATLICPTVQLSIIGGALGDNYMTWYLSLLIQVMTKRMDLLECKIQSSQSRTLSGPGLIFEGGSVLKYPCESVKGWSLCAQENKLQACKDSLCMNVSSSGELGRGECSSMLTANDVLVSVSERKISIKKVDLFDISDFEAALGRVPAVTVRSDSEILELSKSFSRKFPPRTSSTSQPVLSSTQTKTWLENFWGASATKWSLSALLVVVLVVLCILGFIRFRPAFKQNNSFDTELKLNDVQASTKRGKGVRAVLTL